MMRGAQPPGGQPGRPGGAPSQGGLGDLLEQLTQGQPGKGGGLEELLRNLTGGRAGTQASDGGAPTGGGSGGGFSFEDLARSLSPGGQGGDNRTGGQSQGGGLGDILGQFQGRDGQGGGSILDSLGDILKQAAEGTREGAQQIGQNTGAREMIEKMSGGRDPNELLKQLQDFMANNKLGTGAALGGLGALILGTQTGRAVAVNAAKLGAIALIGGLAYKAYQNYNQGQRPEPEAPVFPEAAPQGSGFEEGAVSDTAALAYLRGMIAAAAADGRLDANEQQKITANLVEAGLDRQAEEFIAREISNPATPAELAGSVSNEREAIQLYTAARLAIEVDTAAEQNFLADLAARTGMDPALARHVDATAKNLQS